MIFALRLAILAFSSKHWLLKLLIKGMAACPMVSWSGCFLCYVPCKMNQLDDITHLVNIVGFLYFVVVYCAQDLVQEMTYSDFRSEHVDAKTLKQDWGDSMWTALAKKKTSKWIMEISKWILDLFPIIKERVFRLSLSNSFAALQETFDW